MSRLFGTSGIRGSAKDLFTNQFCFDLGRSFAKFLQKYNLSGSIAVGSDPRESSPRIKQYLCAGLIYEKMKVIDEGIVPIPSLNWLLKSTDYIGSVMITGSHIKEDQNGLKFFAFKDEISKQQEQEITQIYQDTREQIPFIQLTEGLPTELKAKNNYIELLKNIADLPLPRLKIVIDTGNGAQSEVIPSVLKNFNMELILINSRIGDTFMSRDTETDGAFSELEKKVIETKADLGVGFDSDGDRLILVDSQGNTISGDYTGALLAKYAEGNSIVTPINTSQVVDHLGKNVYRTRVGSPYVIERMKEVGAKFGFEANGGTFSSEIMMTRDGGSALIKILNLIKDTGLNISQLIEQLPKYYIYRTKVDCPWELDEKVIQKAQENFLGIRTEKIDGLKIWINQTRWILFRSSQNAPEFRVFAEDTKKDGATKLGEEGIELVREVIKNEN